MAFLAAPQPADAGAVRSNFGFTTSILPRNDDGSTSTVALPFTVNFFGNSYSSLFVNNNGNVTFGFSLGSFTPEGLTGATGIPIIAPFWADVDTRGLGSSEVKYGPDTVNGRAAFGVNFVNVGYYGSHDDKLNSFQLVLIDRSDTGAGNFDIEFNYDRILWETGDASGGSGGFGGTSAGAGYSNGTGVEGTFFEVPGSRIPGSFLDSNSNGLVHRTQGGSVLGRLVFFVRGGEVTTGPPPVISSICGPGPNPPPASISGSTGAQGVLDPANTDSNKGLVWPTGATQAAINTDTGRVRFFAGTNPVGTAFLPGTGIAPAFPDGKIHFLSVRLPSTTAVQFFSPSQGVDFPVILLSCQDVILAAGSNLFGGGGGLFESVRFTSGADLLGDGMPVQFPGFPGSVDATGITPQGPAGFGPRAGSLPSPATLYPPRGGGGGEGGIFTLPDSRTLLGGGSGGAAVVIAATQRITVNGTLNASGLHASGSGQGGAGGSVRLAALLVEGTGAINTSGGQGTPNGPNGPIEIQAFLRMGPWCER
ncbi:MAG: hypothetical protein HY647_06890 [Acidobacteria bacterium]|nr:hypothetical protein [Acidobacteriota bacterium]